MITPSLAIPVQPATAGRAAATNAADDSAAATAVDFATLIVNGIALKPDATDLGDVPAVGKKLTHGDEDKDAAALDPRALLEAIASGQVTMDPKAIAAAAAAAAAATPAPVPVHHGIVPLTAKKSEDTGVAPQTLAIAPRGARDTQTTAKITADAAKGIPQSDAQKAKDPSRDARGTGDDATLPVAVTGTAASTQALQTQAASAVAAKMDVPERANEIATTIATGQSASAESLAAPAPAASRNMAATVTQLERLAQPLGTPAWDDGLANRVVWMAKNDVQSASIRLNPPDLGPVEVRLTLISDPGSPTSASVQFSAAHAATRDAIESSMPRLHEALRESGITLGNTTVDSGNAGHAQNQNTADFGRQSSGNGARGNVGGEPQANIAAQPRSTPIARGGAGLVDTFA